MNHVFPVGEQRQSASEVFEKKCRMYRAPSGEAVPANLKVAVLHKNLLDIELWKHLLRSAATLDSVTSIKDDLQRMLRKGCWAGNCANGRQSGEKGSVKEGKGKEKTVQGKGEGDERRCFYCDGHRHIKSNCPQKVLRDDSETYSQCGRSSRTVLFEAMAATEWSSA